MEGAKDFTVTAEDVKNAGDFYEVENCALKVAIDRQLPNLQINTVGVETARSSTNVYRIFPQFTKERYLQILATGIPFKFKIKAI